MIDWGRVSELYDEIGEDDFDEIVEIFLEEVEDVLTRLGGLSGMALAADLHYLKGSSLNLGFETLAQLCRKGETLAKDDQKVDTDEITATFHTSRQVFALGVSEKLLAS